MAVILRLKRMGTNNRPFYRIVAADQRCPRDGRFLEILGQYDPKLGMEKVTLKPDRTVYWLNQGVKVSGTVQKILKTFRLRKTESLKAAAPKKKKVAKKKAAPKAASTKKASAAAKKPAAKKTTATKK